MGKSFNRENVLGFAEAGVHPSPGQAPGRGVLAPNTSTRLELSGRPGYTLKSRSVFVTKNVFGPGITFGPGIRFGDGPKFGPGFAGGFTPQPRGCGQCGASLVGGVGMYGIAAIGVGPLHAGHGCWTLRTSRERSTESPTVYPSATMRNNRKRCKQ